MMFVIDLPLPPSVNGMFTRRHWRRFSPEDNARLLQDYRSYVERGALAELAVEMGRTKNFICRKARSLGLTNASLARRMNGDKNANNPNMCRWDKTPHPRGMAGKKHNAKTKQRISETSTQRWRDMTEDELAAMVDKQMKAKVAKYGSMAPPGVGRGSWKSGWREIGGQRKFYRSQWEANYARYLNWLQMRGDILDWKHEPETFWFEKIKRGVRSYLPDFRVWENDGTSKLHEVKGWMDSRSHTTLKRMAKYHPHETIILIRAKEYRDIANKLGRLIEGWE